MNIFDAAKIVSPIIADDSHLIIDSSVIEHELSQIISEHRSDNGEFGEIDMLDFVEWLRGKDKYKTLFDSLVCEYLRHAMRDEAIQRITDDIKR